jgi:hypothetical protein
VIDPGDLGTGSRRGQSEAPIADAVLEHLAVGPRQLDVKGDVVFTPLIRLRVIGRVVVVSEGARFELLVAIAGT